MNSDNRRAAARLMVQIQREEQAASERNFQRLIDLIVDAAKEEIRAESEQK